MLATLLYNTFYFHEMRQRRHTFSGPCSGHGKTVLGATQAARSLPAPPPRPPTRAELDCWEIPLEQRAREAHSRGSGCLRSRSSGARTRLSHSPLSVCVPQFQCMLVHALGLPHSYSCGSTQCMRRPPVRWMHARPAHIRTTTIRQRPFTAAACSETRPASVSPLTPSSASRDSVDHYSVNQYSVNRSAALVA